MASYRMTAYLIALLVLSVSILANFWAFHNPYRFDLTAAKIYSVSEETENVLAKITDPVHITFAYDFRNRALKDAANSLQLFSETSDFISVDSFDPILEPALAEANGIRFPGTAIFKSGKRTVYSNEPTETGFTNSLIRVTTEEMGLVCFGDGHLESNPFSLQDHDHSEEHGNSFHNHSSGGRPKTIHERHGMGMARNSLEILGYQIEQRILVQEADALDECSIFVVASPQIKFHPMEIRQIEHYLSKGGRVLMLLEPEVNSGLETLLSTYGIGVGGGRVKDFDRHYWTDPSTPAVTNYPRHRITRELPLTFFPGVSELKSVEITDDLRIDTTVLIATSTRTSAGNDEKTLRSRPIAVMSKELASDAVLIVVGDGDFATNSFFNLMGNGSFFLNLINELSAAKGLLDIDPRHYVEGRLTLSNDQLNTVFVLNILLGPLILLIIGVRIWLSRR